MKRLSKGIMAISILINIAACNPEKSEVNIPEANNGFINSKTYKEYLSHYPDKESISTSDERLFNILQEGEFLYNSNFDFYAIYLYVPNGGNWQCNSLKYRNTIAVSSSRNFSSLKNSFNGHKSSKSADTIYSIGTTFTRVVTKEDIEAFRDKLTNAVKEIKPNAPSAYSTPYRMVLYFDGKEYYRLSDQQLDQKTLGELDTLFRLSPIFKK